MKLYSLRRRLVLLVGGALIVVLAGIALFLYLGVRDAARRQHDDGLAARARALATLVEHDEDGYEVDLPTLADSYIEVRLPDGRVIRSGPALALGDTRDGYIDLALPDGRPGRAVALTFQPRDETSGAQQVTLILAEDVDDVARALAWIRALFLIVGVLSLVVIAGVVSWVVRRALRPLDQLAAHIERIDDRSLARRIPLDAQPAELVAPVRKLNDLLGRLETSFSRERQFTADVSHELRTPLAGLRTLLEVTARAERTAAEYGAAIRDANTIVLQLCTLVENLLTLARLDADQLPITTSDVELRALVDECWKPHAALAASRAVTFRNQLPQTTHPLDREKLRVIIGNLLANAAEYTEAGGWIEISAEDALLVVTDSGPPLPDTIRIFARLWRGDPSRTGTGVHCGIGLALARSLADRIGLTLAAQNTSTGGARFTLFWANGGGGDSGEGLRSVGA